MDIRKQIHEEARALTECCCLLCVSDDESELVRILGLIGLYASDIYRLRRRVIADKYDVVKPM